MLSFIIPEKNLEQREMTKEKNKQDMKYGDMKE